MQKNYNENNVLCGFVGGITLVLTVYNIYLSHTVPAVLFTAFTVICLVGAQDTSD